ncbi:ATP-dependent RecD-like DNA helicase [bioreactor metagenome]|uniref:ATP-dependent RecD-like DNA helicase n=1 Tax=bioreactor metagenome TaxID=1076179 RepID=A0A645BKC2_9ZZZZ
MLDRIRKLLRRIPERFGYDPVDEVQVLTPMNRGACGTIQLNSELQNLLNPASGEGLTVGDRVFRLDDKVMQIANNYDKNIFNGDIGRIRYLNAAKREIAVRFDSERIVPYRGDEFDELVHAYAITVHKAQGCEFPVVILTLLKEHFLMLERNLLYTAMTRAKKLLILIGGVRAVHTAVSNTRREVRYTRLQERLAEMKTLLTDPPAH